MIEQIKVSKKGFVPSVISDTWQLCFVTKDEQYGDLKVLKRHNDTDEAFVLLKGKAELYTSDNDKIEKIEMEQGVMYNIQKSTWHHLKIYDDALLIAVENNNVSSENTERMIVNDNSTGY